MVWTSFVFDTHQLGVRLNFDVDVKILLNFDVDGTNVKMANDTVDARQDVFQSVWTLQRLT